MCIQVDYDSPAAKLNFYYCTTRCIKSQISSSYKSQKKSEERRKNNHNQTTMKLLIVSLQVAVLILAATAVPQPNINLEDDKDDKMDQKSRVLIDLDEMSLEYFPNGTVKLSSAEDMLRLYNLKTQGDDPKGNHTKEQFEKDSENENKEDDENNDRNKRWIFDDDERIRIPNSNLASGHNPFCSLAYVSNGCTAMFIGPYHALTSGHCVYDYSAKRFRSGLSLYRGRNCYRYGTYMSASTYFTVNGYALLGLPEYDYTMV